MTRCSVWSRLGLGLGFVAALSGAGCDGPNESAIVRSCRGESLSESPTCGPYSYSRVVAATVSPEELEPGNIRQDATFHIEIETCGANAPDTVSVALFALVDATDSDAGAAGSSVPLGSITGTVSDTGLTVIDTTITNPLDVRVPGNRSIVWHFVPRLAGATIDGTTYNCEGEAFDVDYVTGPQGS